MTTVPQRGPAEGGGEHARIAFNPLPWRVAPAGSWTHSLRAALGAVVGILASAVMPAAQESAGFNPAPAIASTIDVAIDDTSPHLAHVEPSRSERIRGGSADPARGADAGGSGRRMEGRMPTPAMRTDVPAHEVDLILGRPTDQAITLSVLAYAEREGSVEVFDDTDHRVQQTRWRRFPAGEPVEERLAGLAPGRHHRYRLLWRTPGTSEPTVAAEGGFTTARPRGNSFTFTIQADPHLDYGIDPPTYEKSLRNAVAARTDFHIDLGDTFMTDKYLDYRKAGPHYLAQRYYLGIVGRTAPVFLVLGNHDGEQRGRGGDDAMAVWSNRMRKTYFPNPIPDGFYTGSATPHPEAGLLQNYYAWEWGDALFIVLDPFWYSTRARGGGRDGPVDNWSRTLGREQYDWLARTLAGSRAAHRFVFIHHLAGGETPEGRGGAEASRFFEWGGRDIDGRDRFAQRRPGWPMPVHALLVQHHVTAVFHGHDHIYAQQERDGVVYQLVPQPGHSRTDNVRSAADYGYRSGVIVGASGILRVHVEPERVQVEYVRAYPDAQESAARRSGMVTHRYELSPAFRQEP